MLYSMGNGSNIYPAGLFYLQVFVCFIYGKDTQSHAQ